MVMGFITHSQPTDETRTNINNMVNNDHLFSHVATTANHTMVARRIKVWHLLLLLSPWLAIVPRFTSLQRFLPNAPNESFKSSPPVVGVVAEQVNGNHSQQATTTNKTSPMTIRSNMAAILRHNACPSLFRQERRRNEHVPLWFRERGLVLCRTPKVGSLELRSVAMAYSSNRTFRVLENMSYKGPTVADIATVEEFDAYLHQKNTQRIMLVRHPVTRILSGFLEVARDSRFWEDYHDYDSKGPAPTSPGRFHTWVRESRGLTRYYTPTCDATSTNTSLLGFPQHYAPAQHCRCGIHDCGVEWTVYKVEEHSIRSILSPYFDDRFLPPPSSAVHKKSYNVAEYLTPDILDFLNNLTKEEQQVFGYSPFTL